MKLYDLLGGTDAVDTRIEYSGGLILYIGLFAEHDDANSVGWIFKFTWSSSLPTRIEKLEGIWGNRATLDWA